jgi:hypothetical protein
MKAPFVLAVAALVSTGVLACATRPQLCGGPAACAKNAACVAGQCLRDGATPALSLSKRIVLAPEAAAALEPGESSAGGALPALFTLGRASDRGAMLLLLFDLRSEKITSVLRASVLIDRSDAAFSDPVPISLHADAILARWDGRRVRSGTAPPLEDVRAPRTVVSPSGTRVTRVDVTGMAQRWLAGDSALHGVAIVAENTSPTGVTFAMGGAPLPDRGALGVVSPSHEVTTQAPRLELYVQ